jgi:predicted TIM-barrel fold metal-dependent hydrolase
LLGAGAGAATLAAWRYWPEQGWWNPCRAALPRRLAEHELVRAAWDGIDPARVWDSHAHLVGNGDSGSGIYLNPGMDSVLNPGLYARRLFFLNAGCVHDAPGSVDRSYIERMHNLVDGLIATGGPGVKLVLLAFELAYDEEGRPHPERSVFHVPDAYARGVARAHPRYFEWAASVHPYRQDAAQAVARAKAEGARAVKWLPAAMGIDPASPRCDAFYRALAASGLPLISHAGLERAVLGGADWEDFGNPLRLRRALDAGVRVVVAHCASMGEDRDLDRGEHGPYVDSFSLFARLMGEARYERNLFGDISAVTQLNRAGPALVRVLEEQGWHARLLNGSDYPLPGVMPVYSVDYVVSLGLLAPSAAPLLREIRLHNPLLFDFVLKRHLRSNGKAFSRAVFETRGFFDHAV